jgi:hypothetical protein
MGGIQRLARPIAAECTEFIHNLAPCSGMLAPAHLHISAQHDGLRFKSCDSRLGA